MTRINEALGPLRSVSDFFRTPAFPAGSGPDFVNACAMLETSLPPAEILAVLHGIEAQMGRVRHQRWGQRVIDIDLLGVGACVAPDEETLRDWIDMPMARQKTEAPDRLILPHPRLQDRGFVLVPLVQIAPDWRHPVLGLTVRQMLQRLDPADIADIKPL